MPQRVLWESDISIFDGRLFEGTFDDATSKVLETIKSHLFFFFGNELFFHHSLVQKKKKRRVWSKTKKRAISSWFLFDLCSFLVVVQETRCFYIVAKKGQNREKLLGRFDVTVYLIRAWWWWWQSGRWRRGGVWAWLANGFICPWSTLKKKNCIFFYFFSLDEFQTSSGFYCAIIIMTALIWNATGRKLVACPGLSPISSSTWLAMTQFIFLLVRRVLWSPQRV